MTHAGTDSIAEIIDGLATQGVGITAADGKLVVRSRSGEIPAATVEVLRSRKAEFLAHVSGVADRAAAMHSTPVGVEVRASSVQQRFWWLSQGDGADAYVIVAAYLITGHLDRATWSDAVAAVMRRHGAFSLSFVERDGTLRQRLEARDPPALEGGAGMRLQQADIEALVDGFAATPFAIEGGVLARHGLFSADDGNGHVYVLACHHIIADGQSLNIFFRDLAFAHEALTSGRAVVFPEPAAQYIDAVCAAQGQRDIEQESVRYWVDQLQGAKDALQWPVAPRTDQRDGAHVATLPGGLYERLQTFAREHNLSPFSVFYASFKLLLAKACGTRDFLLGHAVANRGDIASHGAIGCFANAVALRARFSAADSFLDLAQRVNSETIASMQHQAAPLEEIVEQLRGHQDGTKWHGLQAFLSMQESKVPKMRGLKLERLSRTPKRAKFPIGLAIDVDETGCATLVWEYSGHHVGAATAASLHAWYVSLLVDVLASPSQAIGGFPLRGALPSAVVGAVHEKYDDRTDIVSRFRNSVAQYPDKTAIVWGSDRLSYSGLDIRSDLAAARLLATGVAEGDYVGLTWPTGLDRIVALLAILKVGAAYVPMPANASAGRQAELVQLVGARTCVGPSGTRYGGLDCVDPLAATGPTLPVSDLPRRRADSAAYVNFSSGTTGAPKAIACCDSGVVRLVTEQAFATLDETLVMLVAAPIDFDAFTLELWGPLLNGGTCVLSSDPVLGPDELRRCVQRHGVNTLWLTSALFNTLVDLDCDAFDGVRELLVGGDVVSPTHVARTYARHARLEIVNGYGPTENTTFTTCYRIPRHWRPEDALPVGKPIRGTGVFVLDVDGQPAPAGVLGEIVTTGAGLARGYVGRADLTSAAFPQLEVDGRMHRCYRTGDYGFFDSSGDLHFRGRRDGQVKLDGHRFELSSIDHALRSHPGVRDAATVVDAKGPTARLVSFVVFDGEGSAVVRAALAAALEASLAPHQRPKELLAIDALPLNANGKVDRADLVARLATRQQGAVQTLPPCGTYKEIARLWGELLQCAVESPDLNFFHAGGSSLLAIRMIARTNARFGTRLRFSVLIGHPTLVAFADAVKRALKNAGTAIPAESRTPVVATQRQRLLWGMQQLAPDSARYNVHVALELNGPVDARRLINAVTSTYRVHASLHSRFARMADELYCVASLDDSWRPEYVETSASELPSLLLSETKRAFDLERGPVFVARVIRLGVSRHVLQLNAHHAVVDGWSIQALWRRIREEYGGIEGLPAYDLPAGDPPAADAEHATAMLAAQLDGIQALPLLASDAASGATEFVHRSVLSADESGTIARLSTAGDVSQFTVAMAAFALLLAQSTRRDRFVVSTPFANRERTDDRAVGYYATMLPIGFDLGSAATFADLLAATQEGVQVAVAAADHDPQRLLRLLGMDEGRSDNPLQRAVFAWQDELAAFADLEGAAVARLPVPAAAPKFPLMLTMTPGAGGATLAWEFDPGAVPLDEVMALDQGFRVALANLANDVSLATFAIESLPRLLRSSAVATTTAAAGESSISMARAAIRQVWSDLLGVAAGATDANFFSLGGSSLLCLRVQAELRKRYGLHADISAFLRYPTVDALAARIAKAAPAAVELPGQQPMSGVAFPLSREQQRIWIAHSLSPSSAYNVPLLFELTGDVEPERLRGALRAFVARHPALRSRVELGEAGPVQAVVDGADWDVGVRDVDDDAALAAAIAGEVGHVFDLERGMSSRAVLLRMRAARSFLVLNVHHAFFDGHSLGVLLQELPALYQGSPLAAAEHGMATVVEWQTSHEYLSVRAAALEHWRERLRGAPVETALPCDLGDTALRGHAGAHRLVLDGGDAAQAQALARRLGTSEFSFWLAVLSVVLARLGQQDDLVIATPAANRLRHEFGTVVGLLASTLPVRLRVDGDDSFEKLLRAVFDHVVADLAHQNCPLEELGGRPADADTPPWSQVLFSVSSGGRASGEGWCLEQRPVQSARTKYPLAITVVTREDGVEWLIEFDRGRYSPFAIAQFANVVERVLRWVGGSPQRALREIQLVDATPPELPTPAFVAVTELIRRRALKQCPASIAIHGEHASMTYTQLWTRVERYALVLRQAGAAPGRRVGVVMQRCDELPIVLLAILVVGAVYVPIDPAYPRERVEWILTDARPELLVVDGNELAASLATTAIRVSVDALERGPAVTVDAEPGPAPVGPDDLAYIIYTSGSTGRPKGVAIRHDGVSRLQQWAAGTYSRDDLENVLAGTSVCFDLSVFEIFVTWSLGGAITFGQSALDLIEDPRSESVTLINTVPSLLREVLRSARLPGRLRVLNLAGEALAPQLVEEIARSVPAEVRVFNLYGPSEDTTYSTCSPVDLGRPSSVNIGQPLPGTIAHVLDAEGRPMPEGFPGELYLSGRGLAAGYFNAPALTAERFPPADAAGPRRYRTGDKVRRTASGNLDYLGRLDHQCKIRGFRIELLEVDAAMRRIHGIEQACAVVRRDSAGGDVLAGMVTTKPGAAFDEQAIKQALRLDLPEYMVPGRLYLLDRMPLTPSGKIDRNALSAQASHPGEAPEKQAPAPASASGTSLRQLVESVVGFAIPDVHAPLLDYGVHSLQVIRLSRALSERFGRRVTPGEIYAHPTLFELERRLGDAVPVAPAAMWSVVEQVHRLCDRHRVPTAQFAAARGTDVLLVNHGIQASPGALSPAERGLRLSCNLKLLTLLLTLRMVENGVFALEDLVTDLLPEWSGHAVWEGVRVEHLLSHCHGLDFAADASAFQTSLTIAELANHCAGSATRMFAPGSMYGYSMVGHTVVAFICERHARSTFHDLLTTHVLAPLGVRLRVGDAADDRNAILTGHLASSDGPVALSVPGHVPALLPSGTLGAYLSTEDLLRVGRSLILESVGGTGLLRDATVQRIYAQRMPIENHPILAAAGLTVIEFENGYWGHLGDGDGQHSSLQIDPERGVVLACAASLYPAAALFGEVAGKLFPPADRAASSGKPIASPQSDQSISGRYRNRASQVVTVAGEGALRLELHRGDTADECLGVYPLVDVDPDRSIYRLVQPTRTVKGSVTYFGNAQGNFMRIGQILFKKSLEQLQQ